MHFYVRIHPALNAALLLVLVFASPRKIILKLLNLHGRVCLAMLQIEQNKIDSIVLNSHCNFKNHLACLIPIRVPKASRLVDNLLHAHGLAQVNHVLGQLAAFDIQSVDADVHASDALGFQ